jgi:hypothetical protein
LDNDGSVTELTSRSLPIGAFRGTTYGSAELQLESAETLVLYTDGVTEARRGKEFFGEERLIEVIRRAQSAERLSQEILSAVEQFSGGNLADDLNHEFRPQGLRRFEVLGSTLRREDDLRLAIPVAQIDEHHAALVAIFIDPAAERYAVPHVFRPQFAASMCPQQFRVPIKEGFRSEYNLSILAHHLQGG